MFYSSLFLLLFSLVSCRQISYSPFDNRIDSSNIIGDELSQLSSLEGSISYPFKIAFISDTHNDYDELKDFVDYINRNADQYAFVMHSGDITTHGTKREYEVLSVLFRI